MNFLVSLIVIHETNTYIGGNKLLVGVPYQNSGHMELPGCHKKYEGHQEFSF